MSRHVTKKRVIVTIRKNINQLIVFYLLNNPAGMQHRRGIFIAYRRHDANAGHCSYSHFHKILMVDLFIWPHPAAGGAGIVFLLYYFQKPLDFCSYISYNKITVKEGLNE